MAPVENAETSGFPLGEHSRDSVLNLLGCCVHRFHRGRLGGFGKAVDQGSQRALDFCDLSLPIGFTGRYNNLKSP